MIAEATTDTTTATDAVHHLPFLCPEDEKRPCLCWVYNRRSHRCKECWRTWAGRRYLALARRLEAAALPGTMWHHIQLNLRFHADRTLKSKMLSSWLGSLKRKYRKHGGVRYAWVWHQKREGVHVHLVVGTVVEIIPEWAIGRWRRIMNKYGKVPYEPRDAYCQPARTLRSSLSYMLGVNRRHPRRTMPWGSLVGKVAGTNVRRKPMNSTRPR